MNVTMSAVSRSYDLWYDPNEVGPDFVVECWISHGPRRDDDAFDPREGNILLIGDDEEVPMNARVIHRDGDRVRVQVLLPASLQATA